MKNCEFRPGAGSRVWGENAKLRHLMIFLHSPDFPAPSETKLNFLKPGSREVLHRKVCLRKVIKMSH